MDARSTTDRYRGVSYKRPITAAKEAIAVVDLADLLCGPGGLRRVGAEWVACCPLPDHEDLSPSFTANPEKNVWFCHGCLRGGDVVELARLAWGYDQREAHTAAAMLLMEFGHEIPQPPPAWFRKHERQAPVRVGIEEAERAHVQRRLYRVFAPHIERIEDDEERQEEKAAVWNDLRAVAAMIVAGRRSA